MSPSRLPAEAVGDVFTAAKVEEEAKKHLDRESTAGRALPAGEKDIADEEPRVSEARQESDKQETSASSESEAQDAEPSTSSGTLTARRDQLLPGVMPPPPAPKSLTPATRKRSGFPLRPIALVAWTVIAALLYRRMKRGNRPSQRRNRSRGGSAAAAEAAPPQPEPEPIDPDTFSIIAVPLEQPAAAATASAIGSLPQPLEGVTFVVSEDVDLTGTPTTLGAPSAVLTDAAASSSSAVQKLQAAGAVCVGKSAMQPLGLDVLGASYGNPYNRASISGGGQTGAALAVSTGMAAAALCTDVLGSARVPAACCGVYAYRATPGAVGHANAAASDSSPEGIESVALMAADPAVLLKGGQALGAPGSFNLRGELIRFVVAEDLFGTCAVEYQPAGLAIKRAILKWAGAEQAGAVQLCKFMADNSGGWQQVAIDPDYASMGTLPPGLAAWATAGRALRDAHLRNALPALAAAEDEQAAAAAPAAAAAAAADASAEAGEGGGKEAQEGAGAAEGNGHVAEAAAEGAEAAEAKPRLLLPPAPTPERLEAAREAAAQLYDTLRHTVKPDTIIVMPVVPAAPLKRRAAVGGGAAGAAGSIEAAAWAGLSTAFCSLATLAQCPVVVVPLGSVADGTHLSAALMGCSKFDARLLAVASKIGPVMQEMFQAVKDGLAEAVRKQQEQEERGGPSGQQQQPQPQGSGSLGAAAAAAAARGSSGGGGAAGGGPAAAAAAAAAVDPRKAERAERYKAKGNELFKAGKHAEALAEYSRAIQEHPENPVYYNNRAMACLKIFRFEQAEEDCNRALRFDLKEADKAKALLRRATARTALQKYTEAEKDLRQVLAVEPNNRQAREDLHHLQQMKADMQAAQQRMVQDFQQQRLLAGGGAAAPPGAAGGANTQHLPGGLPPGFLPPDFDPASLPPGFDMRSMAQADPQAHAALMSLMAQAQGGGAGGMGGGPGVMGPPGMGGMGGMGGMFGGR